MAKFQISWMESKTTSTGKNKHDLTLQGEDGTTGDNITMWGDFPGFSDFKPGSTVEGDIVTKVNGQYTNKTIYPIKVNNAPTGSFAPKAGGFKAGMAKMVEQKQAGIAKSQERKEDSIMTSSTFRDATILTNLELQGSVMNAEDIKQTWTKWRFWLAEQWDLEVKDFKQPF